MREIKFRVWDKKTKKMREETLVNIIEAIGKKVESEVLIWD